jgi:hypothetical protein
MKFLQKVGYVAPNDYPYKSYLGAKRQCLAIKDKSAINRLPSNFRARQWVTLSVDLLKQLVSIQPASVAINAVPVCVRNYKSGILKPSDCPCTSKSYDDLEVNEIMTIVGYGNVEPSAPEYNDCSGYWKLRASFGPSWGERGHIRLCIPRGQEQTDSLGTCNVQSYPAAPDIGMIRIPN